MSPRAFIFIGRSGCGKGTQAKLLEDHLKRLDPGRGVFYLQTGAEFRQFVKGPTPTQNLAWKIYEAGGLQPEFLAVHMWANVLIRGYSGSDHLIIDGTPRKFHEAGVLDSVFGFYSLGKPRLIYLNVGERWATERLLARGRADDNKEDIAARLGWFATDVLPAIDFYRRNPSYTFIEINGERTIESVWRDIQGQLDLS